MLKKHIFAQFLVFASCLPATADFSLYTSMPTVRAEAFIEAFEQKHPEIDITLVRAGSTRTILSIETEAATGDVQADVVLIADERNMARLKRHGLLLASSQRDVSGLPDGTYDPDRTYFGTRRMSVVLVYNRDRVPEPDSWRALERAEPGRAILTNPLTAGSAFANTFYLESVLGWEFFEALAANQTRIMRRNIDVLEAVAEGSADYGTSLDYLAVEAAAENPDLGIVYPKEGVVTMYQPVAILKDTDQPEQAQIFVDYLLSPEGQALIAALGYRPLLPGISAITGFPPEQDIALHNTLDVENGVSEREFREHFRIVFGSSFD